MPGKQRENRYMRIWNKSPRAAALVALAATWAAFTPAWAEGTIKVGLIVPLTGGQASTGKQLDNAVKLYIQQHGDTVAGKKIEIILRDDAANPETTKRLAQELIVNDRIDVLAGFGITPAALAVAPLATQAKIPEIVMLAGTSIITERSPYIVRTSFTLAQSSTIIGDWAATNGIKKVATLTSDYAPGNDALNFFKQHFIAGGGEIVEEVKVPLANPDFAPFLQRMKDSRPDAMFVFVPGGQGGNFMKQYAERGLDKAGIKVIGPGDVMDDDLLNGMGDAALGTVTAHMYSAALPLANQQGFCCGLPQSLQCAARVRCPRRL
jgi:branched-chain amino acid transport system substrate-binding protein